MRAGGTPKEVYRIPAKPALDLELMLDGSCKSFKDTWSYCNRLQLSERIFQLSVSCAASFKEPCYSLEGLKASGEPVTLRKRKH